MDNYKAEQIALNRFLNGEQYSVSTFIDEDTILAGYGQLQVDFEYPLPVEIIRMEYGTLSWKQWFKFRGFSRYKAIEKSNPKNYSITPLFDNKELEKHKLLNPNFIFEKII